MAVSAVSGYYGSCVSGKRTDAKKEKRAIKYRKYLKTIKKARRKAVLQKVTFYSNMEKVQAGKGKSERIPFSFAYK